MTELLDDFEPQTVTVSLPLSVADRALLERLLGRPSTNGHAAVGFQNVCSSCGKEYSAYRRPKAGKRNYCADCRAAGEPVADRMRDYRERKRQEVQG